MTLVAIHQPQYLPWVPYFSKAMACDLFVYLDHVQFQKNGVQNRNQIKTANGPAWLTVPVKANLETKINETIIDNTQAWRQKHLRSIENAYARAPFKSLLEVGLRQLLEKDWEHLSDLNIAVTDWMFDQLKIRCKRVRSSELGISGTKSDLVINICKSVGATTYLSGQGAKAYQDEAAFEKAGVSLTYHQFVTREYPQCFPKLGYVSGLSCLDLILNTGEQSMGYL